jgi:hypothetical protein
MQRGNEDQARVEGITPLIAVRDTHRTRAFISPLRLGLAPGSCEPTH